MQHTDFDLAAHCDASTLGLLPGVAERLKRAIWVAYYHGAQDSARRSAQLVSELQAHEEAQKPGGIDPATYGR